MPKVGMHPIRRRQLIEATIQCIHRYGLLDTTVKRISTEAGVSPGIINHYFGSKDGMLEATMREILLRIQRVFAKRLRDCATHEDRLKAIIWTNFSPEQIDPAATSTWLAFWAQAMHVPSLARLQNINARRLHSNLLYSFKRVLPKEEAILAAQGTAALIDGMWLRGALQKGGINAELTQQVLWSYVEKQCSAVLSRGSPVPPGQGEGMDKDGAAFKGPSPRPGGRG